MKEYYKNRDICADKKIKEMKECCESKKSDEKYIRELVGEQKGELSVNSIYWKKEKIAEGNWSLIEDSRIKDLDKETVLSKSIIYEEPVDAMDVMLGLDSYSKERCKIYLREKNAEYEYVFIPSYYAVITLIKYYLKDKKEALKIYGLKNAVVRKEIKRGKEIYYGGLPFILKYLKRLQKDKGCSDLKNAFADIMQEVIDCKCGLNPNNEIDEFINDIVNCIKKSKCKDFILEKRIKDFECEKEKFYIECKVINEYKILEHRDVKKDWLHLRKSDIKKAERIIDNTPYFPKNVPPKNELLTANIKEWYSQRISQKDRVVYKKDSKEKVVYIATVCDHYKDAERRSKSKQSYR